MTFYSASLSLFDLVTDLDIVSTALNQPLALVFLIYTCSYVIRDCVPLKSALNLYRAASHSAM